MCVRPGPVGPASLLRPLVCASCAPRYFSLGGEYAHVLTSRGNMSALGLDLLTGGST